MNSGRINRTRIDKTMPVYDRKDRKVDLSELHKKDKKRFKTLGWIIAGWVTVMVLIYLFAELMLKFS